MKRICFAFFLGLTMLAGTSFAQSPIKMTLGIGAAPGNPRHLASEKFAERVKERTNGRYDIFVAHSAQLGDDAQMITALRSGTLDISANSQGAIAAVVPEYAALGLPFLFANVEKAWELLDGPVGKELADKTAGKGMIVLGYWDNGIRHITNNKHPIKVPADVSGMKLRTPPDAVTVDIVKSLGGDAQQIKFAELYVALQQGVVDGQENPLANIVSSKLYEVQKYLSLSGHKYETTPFVISKRTWDKLSGDDKKIFQEAAVEATAFQRKLSKEADVKLEGELKDKGVQINTIERDQFIAATQSVYDKWLNGEVGDFAKRVVQASK